MTTAVAKHAPSVLARSWRPSVGQAVATVFSVFSIPLLLLAAVSAAKLMAAAGLLSPVGWLKAVIDWQSVWVERARHALAVIRIAVPSFAIDGAMLYAFVGNVVARAESDHLMAVTLDDGENWQTFKRSLFQWRADYFFYSLPWPVRWLAIRLLWPIASIYRFGTPFIVDGPGPDGDELSTSVRRREIDGFIDMLAEAGALDKQTIYDGRIILFVQLLLGLSSSLALHAVAKWWS